jgi:hypothetical protein
MPIFDAHRNGLRSFPTFFINILTMYGNILVYFQLPDWVKDWNDSLVEKDDDPSDVIALKVKSFTSIVFEVYVVRGRDAHLFVKPFQRFLKGDDEYKAKSLKVLPGTT